MFKNDNLWTRVLHIYLEGNKPHEGKRDHTYWRENKSKLSIERHPKSLILKKLSDLLWLNPTPPPSPVRMFLQVTKLSYFICSATLS